MWTLALPSLQRYLLPILIGVALAVLTASHGWAYSQGKQGERVRQEAKQLAAEQQALARQEKLADELEKAQKKRTEDTKETIRYVYRMPDPTGCIATPVLDDWLFHALGGSSVAPR
jgi:uncharacterized membrane protein YdbT with pleckstrin-like domain